jgi:hypothetical protein
MFMALDEVVYTDTEITTADFTLAMLDKMIALNRFYQQQWPMFPGFQWRHWSDNSATSIYRPTVGGFDSSLVYKVSGGQIDLVGVEKPAGSVEEDIKMIRMLLREGRLFVGANCPWLRRCLREITKGPKGIIRTDDKLKHIFDAFRYAIRSEWMEEFANDPLQPKKAGSGLIHVPLR